MRKKYIPTLQEYAKKRRKQRAELLELTDCENCDYFKDEMGVCIWNDNVRTVSMLDNCPMIKHY